MPGTVLETRGISVNKRDRNACSLREGNNDRNHTFVLWEMLSRIVGVGQCRGQGGWWQWETSRIGGSGHERMDKNKIQVQFF